MGVAGGALYEWSALGKWYILGIASPPRANRIFNTIAQPRGPSPARSKSGCATTARWQAPDRAVSWVARRLNSTNTPLLFAALGVEAPHAQRSHSPAPAAPVASGMAAADRGRESCRRCRARGHAHRHVLRVLLGGLTVGSSERAIEGGDAFAGGRAPGALSFFYFPSAKMLSAPVCHRMLWPSAPGQGNAESKGLKSRVLEWLLRAGGQRCIDGSLYT